MDRTRILLPYEKIPFVAQDIREPCGIIQKEHANDTLKLAKSTRIVIVNKDLGSVRETERDISASRI